MKVVLLGFLLQVSLGVFGNSSAYAGSLWNLSNKEVFAEVSVVLNALKKGKAESLEKFYLEFPRVAELFDDIQEKINFETEQGRVPSNGLKGIQSSILDIFFSHFDIYAQMAEKPTRLLDCVLPEFPEDQSLNSDFDLLRRAGLSLLVEVKLDQPQALQIYSIWLRHTAPNNQLSLAQYIIKKAEIFGRYYPNSSVEVKNKVREVHARAQAVVLEWRAIFSEVDRTSALASSWNSRDRLQYQRETEEVFDFLQKYLFEKN